jgi:glutathione-regulated potassium-efflux system ancillary protein KefG
MSSSDKPRVTVLFFHPYFRRSKMHRALLEGIRGVQGIEFRDMYEIYPDFAIDIAREQEVLIRSDVLVFQHPFYWYSCPALMKEWIDLVLELGWAYGPEGTKLQGKHWIEVISTGGAEDAYGRAGHNRFSIAELLRPLEQTAWLCGMRWREPLVFHGAHRATEADRTQAGGSYRGLLQSLTEARLPREAWTHL